MTADLCNGVDYLVGGIPIKKKLYNDMMFIIIGSVS